jgi:hypothetical protein
MTHRLSSPDRQTIPSETSATFVSGTSAGPMSEKAALRAQQYENVQQPLLYRDSMRSEESEELEPAFSRPPREIPPTYSSIGS